MDASGTRVGGRLRQPEYTGENRCLPCTVVNVVFASIVGAGAAVVNPLLGLGILGVSLAAIYFRGYLVPGTPALTKRYVPDWLLAKFDKEPEHLSRVAAGQTDDETNDPQPPEAETPDPETALLDGGVVEPCAEEDDLCLTGSAESDWREAIDELREGNRETQIAELLGTDPAAIELRSTRSAVTVTSDGQPVARWESDAAVLADLGGHEMLGEYVDGWEACGLDVRSQLASGLRAFVDDCPSCEGSISVDEETVESCCRSHEVYAITCENCEARILEVAG